MDQSSLKWRRIGTYAGLMIFALSAAVKSSWVKINGGFFLKHIRQVIEEEYSGFEVLKK